MPTPRELTTAAHMLKACAEEPSQTPSSIEAVRSPARPMSPPPGNGVDRPHARCSRSGLESSLNSPVEGKERAWDGKFEGRPAKPSGARTVSSSGPDSPLRCVGWVLGRPPPTPAPRADERPSSASPIATAASLAHLEYPLGRQIHKPKHGGEMATLSVRPRDKEGPVGAAQGRLEPYHRPRRTRIGSAAPTGRFGSGHQVPRTRRGISI